MNWIGRQPTVNSIQLLLGLPSKTALECVCFQPLTKNCPAMGTDPTSLTTHMLCRQFLWPQRHAGLTPHPNHTHHLCPPWTERPHLLRHRIERQYGNSSGTQLLWCPSYFAPKQCKLQITMDQSRIFSRHHWTSSHWLRLWVCISYNVRCRHTCTVSYDILPLLLQIIWFLSTPPIITLSSCSYSK